MLSEMGRVIKRNGHIYIITHSGPEGRKRVFQDGLSFKSYDYFFSKIYLSNSNILVNLLKANRMNTN
jgi:ribosomal protein L36